MHDETPCKAYAQQCSFTSYGVQIESDAGKIKADNATLQKSQKLLYRGTGNIQFRFFIYRSKVFDLNFSNVEANGNKQVLQDTRDSRFMANDISYDSKSNTLFVPSFSSNKVTAYVVK
jgi:hypothetical protein